MLIRNKILFCFIIVVFVLVGSLFAALEQGVTIDVLQSSDSVLKCKVRIDSVVYRQELIDKQWFSVLDIPGCAFLSETGVPKLPVKSMTFAIPEGKTARLTVLDQNVINKNDILLPPVQSLAPKASPIKDFTITTGNWFPQKTINIGMTGYVREQHILQVEFFPVRYLADAKLVQIIKSITFQIDFIDSNSDSKKSITRDAQFNSILKHNLANFSATSKSSKLLSSPLKTFKISDVSGVKYKISIKTDGVYVITGQQLADAGADLAQISPSLLSLANKGIHVPIIVEGDGDGTFDKEDRILFYGEHNRGDDSYYSYFSDTNVYWLSWDGTPGARFADVTAAADEAVQDTITYAKTKEHRENDLRYDQLLSWADGEGDHWFWQQIQDGQDYSYNLPGGTHLGDHPVRVRIGLNGLTNPTVSPDHHLIVKLDEEEIGNVYWDNQESYIFDSGYINIANLQEKEQLVLSIPGDIAGAANDHMLLNWIEFELTSELAAEDDYLSFIHTGSVASMYKMTNFSDDKVYLLSPDGYRYTDVSFEKEKGVYSFYFKIRSNLDIPLVAVSERRLKSVSSIQKVEMSNLKSTSNGADYIIITHPDFEKQAQELADFRATQNLRTKVVDIYDIYNEFSFGNYDPRAVKYFIKYAYENWTSPAPLYILLFGDTSRYMDKNPSTEEGFKSYVPTMMVYTVTWGMTSSDNYFAAVSGSDDLPDLHIGRFPANTAEEAQAMVDKTISHEKQQAIDSWRRNVCLLTGNGEFFETSAQYLYDYYIPQYMVTNRVATLPSSRYFGSTENVADYLNAGQAVLNFIGHGGGGVYFDSELFLPEDVERLTNKDKYPVVFSMTCFTGSFANPEEQSLAEILLRSPDKGVVAHFGSAGRAYLYGDYFLNNALFQALFDYKMQTVGEVCTYGKIEMVNQTKSYYDHVKNYILMGDPATRFHFAPDEINLTLSKNIVIDGDKLMVTGTIPGSVNGNVLLSVYNNLDSLLVEKSVTASNGTFSVKVLTVDAGFRNGWKTGHGQGIVRAYFNNDQSDAAGSVSFSLNEAFLSKYYTTPAGPSHNEEVMFFAELDPENHADVGGLDSVYVKWTTNNQDWIKISMTETSGGIWKSDSSLVKAEGTRVFYQMIVKAKNGTVFESAVSEYMVKKRADLTFVRDSIFIVGSDNVRIALKIRNKGETDCGAFAVRASIKSETDEPQPISSDVNVAGLKALSDTLIQVDWPAATAGYNEFMAQVDVLGQVDESAELNNMVDFNLNVVTKENGTNGIVTDLKNNFQVEIPQNSFNKNISVKFERMENDQYLKTARQLSLTPVRFRNETYWTVYRIQFSDSTIKSTKPFKVTAYFDKLDSAYINLSDPGNAFKIFAWQESTETWLGLASQVNLADGSVAANLPQEYSVFTVMASNDGNAPIISIGLEGQHLADNDIVSPRPVFVITFQDSSGFNLGNSPFTLFMDDEQISDDQFVLSYDQQTKNQVVLTFKSELEYGDHEITVRAVDIHGNSSEQSVAFSISGEFKLAAIANHPNPFADETVIAFTLTGMAKEVKLDIYTVSGRMIRSYEFIDISGYWEQDWDGRDEDGNEVANGVYYLKFVAKNDSKTIEQIEKMAKLK